MTIKILQQPNSTFTTTCGRCNCKFTYTLSDLRRNYVRGAERVSCPGCAESILHRGAWS